MTNALRHAPGARTDIVITAEPSTVTGGTDLVIRVTNDAVANDAVPAGGRAGGPPGTGAGLLGLAERLRLYHGTLRAGPRANGGFEVLARIPAEAQLPIEEPPSSDERRPVTAS